MDTNLQNYPPQISPIYTRGPVYLIRNEKCIVQICMEIFNNLFTIKLIFEALKNGRELQLLRADKILSPIYIPPSSCRFI